MPVILTQHYAPSDRIYEDAEFSLYHYPRVYFSRVRPYDRYIYYRPLGKSRVRGDSKMYFGHGILGDWFDDPNRPNHRFVNLISGELFSRPVPIQDLAGRYYETETTKPPQFQAAVRDISEITYYKLLAAGDVRSAGLSLMPTTENIAATPPPVGLPGVPRDVFREIDRIPPGAGYVPSGETILNVYESAALQERARRDHQGVLATIQAEVNKRGGITFYNNNVDLFASIGASRMLVEAKSLGDVRAAVDRVRYGIGQVADYSYRYADELQGAQKVLAVGARMPSALTWLGNVLDAERTAFLYSLDGTIEPMNDTAQTLPLFA